MMNDLISRKEAIKILKSMMQDCFPEAKEELDAIVTTVREIPSVELDNQVHLCDSCYCCYPVCPAMNNEVIFGNGKGHDNICACAKYIPSAESVRKAKVMKHKYWLGVSLNVVGEQIIDYEWICENCKKKVIDGDDYCSHCGCKLEWNK